MYFPILDSEICVAYSLKGMTSRPPLKVLKVSPDCLLCHKVERIFLMVVVSMLPHAEIGGNDHREDAPQFINV